MVGSNNTLLQRCQPYANSLLATLLQIALGCIAVCVVSSAATSRQVGGQPKCKYCFDCFQDSVNEEGCQGCNGSACTGTSTPTVHPADCKILTGVTQSCVYDTCTISPITYRCTGGPNELCPEESPNYCYWIVDSIGNPQQITGCHQTSDPCASS